MPCHLNRSTASGTCATLVQIHLYERAYTTVPNERAYLQYLYCCLTWSICTRAASPVTPTEVPLMAEMEHAWSVKLPESTPTQHPAPVLLLNASSTSRVCCVCVCVGVCTPTHSLTHTHALSHTHTRCMHSSSHCAHKPTHSHMRALPQKQTQTCGPRRFGTRSPAPGA
jgi:hypothetical protein